MVSLYYGLYSFATHIQNSSGLSECQKDFKKSGSVQSPMHPDRYPLNALCDWSIAVPKNKMLHVAFSSFDVRLLKDIN